MEETVATPVPRAGAGRSLPAAPAEIQSLANISSNDQHRISIPLEEFNRVLGGGMVPGSAILLGGDPGVGKSTLLLQVCQLAAAAGERVLYATGEESPQQLKLRAERLGAIPDGVDILAESDTDSIIQAASATCPRVLIVDSIQTARTADLESAAGTPGQLRESAARLVQLAKSSNTTVFLVGHVTKEGSLAGPKLLEHMVDVVLYLEGDHFQTYRLLRSVKNRYGPSHEIGVFDMRGTGLMEVADPSSLFVNKRGVEYSGGAMAVTIEGTRPLVVEIQALATRTTFGLPRRSANGIDVNRLHMLTAVLSKRARVDVSGDDVYVNVVGGLRLVEPALDLATAAAIYSSHCDVGLRRAVVIGEVGLGGEVRPVQQVPRRLGEARRFGVTEAVVPGGSRLEDGDLDGMNVVEVDSISDAVAALAVT